MDLELKFLQPSLTLRICIVALSLSVLELEFIFEALVASLGHLEVVLAFAPFLKAGTLGQSVVIELFNSCLLVGSLARSRLAAGDSSRTLVAVGLYLE